MRRPSSSPPLHRLGGGIIISLFPLLLLLAAFSISLLATLSVTRTLTTWTLGRKIAAVRAAARWGGGFRDGVSTVDADLLLGSHLALFDDGDDGEEEEEEEETPPPPPSVNAACAPMEHTDYFGTPIVEGPDFVVASALECCEACSSYKPAEAKKRSERGSKEEEADPSLECSLWVFCGDGEACGDSLGQCWLKHLAWPEASNPRTGPDVPWTSGLRSGRLSPALEEEKEEEEKRGEKVDGRRRSLPLSSSPPPPSSFSPSSSLPRNRRAYHVAITASGPAVHWQSRVHYYWYLKQKRACEEEARRKNEEEEAAAELSSAAETAMQPFSNHHRCDMGGFTRVLHDPSGTPDDLSREIPTFVASPLPGGADGGYVVLNRPWAFVQWLSAAKIEEEFVLMAEPDHLWLRPFQNPCPLDGSPAAFPFFYIEPSKEEYLPLVARALGRKTGVISRREAETVAPVGNSPTWMKTADLTELAPLWMETSLRMFRDAETKKAWGWVLEMYGFTVSMHKKKVEARRLEEEAAVVGALAVAVGRKKKEEGRGGGGGGGSSLSSSSSSSSSLSSFFPPLSEEASEVALEARREFRREQKKKKKQRRRNAEGGDAADDDGSRSSGSGVGGRENGKVRVLPRVMLQPPWDSRLSPGAALLHYTYGCDYSLNGTFLPGERGEWRFDKREWASSPPTRKELRELKESAPAGVRENAPATFRIVEMLLEAVEAIPGWDGDYASSGVATEFWDGETFL